MTKQQILSYIQSLSKYTSFSQTVKDYAINKLLEYLKNKDLSKITKAYLFKAYLNNCYKYNHYLKDNISLESYLENNKDFDIVDSENQIEKIQDIVKAEKIKQKLLDKKAEFARALNVKEKDIEKIMEFLQEKSSFGKKSRLVKEFLKLARIYLQTGIIISLSKSKKTKKFKLTEEKYNSIKIYFKKPIEIKLQNRLIKAIGICYKIKIEKITNDKIISKIEKKFLITQKAKGFGAIDLNKNKQLLKQLKLPSLF